MAYDPEARPLLILGLYYRNDVHQVRNDSGYAASELGRQINKNPRAITSLVRKMAEDGLVVIDPHLNIRVPKKTYIIRLTPKGVELAERLIHERSLTREKFLAGKPAATIAAPPATPRADSVRDFRPIMSETTVTTPIVRHRKTLTGWHRPLVNTLLGILEKRSGVMYRRAGLLEREVAAWLDLSEDQAMELIRVMARTGRIHREAWSCTVYGICLPDKKHKSILDSMIMGEDQLKPNKPLPGAKRREYEAELAAEAA